MNCTEIGIFEETNEVSFRSLLESHNCRTLESQVGLEILSDFTYQPLEGKLSDEQFDRLLVSSDLTESDSSWPVSVGLLDSSS